MYTGLGAPSLRGQLPARTDIKIEPVPLGHSNRADASNDLFCSRHGSTAFQNKSTARYIFFLPPVCAWEDNGAFLDSSRRRAYADHEVFLEVQRAWKDHGGTGDEGPAGGKEIAGAGS